MQAFSLCINDRRGLISNRQRAFFNCGTKSTTHSDMHASAVKMRSCTSTSIHIFETSVQRLTVITVTDTVTDTSPSMGHVRDSHTLMSSVRYPRDLCSSANVDVGFSVV